MKIRTEFATAAVAIATLAASGAYAQGAAKMSAAPSITADTQVYTREQAMAAPASYYPPKAQDEEREGMASLACHVIDDLGFDTCVVLLEEPPGYGFGQVAAFNALRKARVGGTFKSGDWITLTQYFRLEAAAPFAPAK